MPSCSKQKNPNGDEITFYEDTHKYVSIIKGKEINYISGTTFISQFFKPFDPDGSIAARVAKRDGLTVEQVQAKWKKAGKDSCEFGTRIHRLCEYLVNGLEPIDQPNQTVKEKLAFTNAEKIALKFKKNLDIIATETIVFDPSLQIAGTIDLLARSKKDNSLLILDYKTNKEIVKDNKYNQFALSPIELIPDTNLHHYALQLSLYEFLLKSSGRIAKTENVKRALIHITEAGSEIISLPDYSLEIRDMIINYLSNKITNIPE